MSPRRGRSELDLVVWDIEEHSSKGLSLGLFSSLFSFFFSEWLVCFHLLASS